MGFFLPRIRFFEINDQPWFPQYLREMVQSGLAMAWTFRAPVLQRVSPAQLVALTLQDALSDSIAEYVFIDLCAGAGGPTPFIEQEVNAKLTRQSHQDAVEFVLTDLHPHLSDWKEAAGKSDNLTFVAEPVDATDADFRALKKTGRKTFRLFHLAFHHFDDKLAVKVLESALDSGDGFAIFELQHRTISSLITVLSFGVLLFIITPFYFWRSPGHLFFTYVIPIVPFVLVFDGLVSSLRTRTFDEVKTMIHKCDVDEERWTLTGGEELHTWPTGYMNYIIGIKNKR